MFKASSSVGVLFIVAVCATCGGKSAAPTPAGGGGSGGDVMGAAGDSGAAGAQPDASDPAGAAGAAGGAGASGASDAGDDAAQDTGAGAEDGSDGAACSDGAADACAGPDGNVVPDLLGPEILKVRSSSGCGRDPGIAIGMPVRGLIATNGVKAAGCADSVCGPWSYVREYYVTLPAGYDKSRAYPLVLEATDAGGTGLYVYSLNSVADDSMPAHSLVDNSVIRVGLTPPPNAIGHATNPNQGDFDDHEGDDSVDWVFYENLYDLLEVQVCFDRNRVFVAGSGRGATLVDDFGCKFAGDGVRPIRGILSNAGGLLPAMWLPTCTGRPLAGIWIHQTGDTRIPFSQAAAAIARAMKVDGCTIGTGLPDAQLDDFPIGGANLASTCKKIRGCPPSTPLVICQLLGNASAFEAGIANPAFSTFIKLFETAPLLTP
jgi:hypothetical protein